MQVHPLTLLAMAMGSTPKARTSCSHECSASWPACQDRNIATSPGRSSMRGLSSWISRNSESTTVRSRLDVMRARGATTLMDHSGVPTGSAMQAPMPTTPGSTMLATRAKPSERAWRTMAISRPSKRPP